MRHQSLRLLTILLLFASVLAALPAAAAPNCVLHEKSARGLMPPLCLPAEGAPQLADAPGIDFLSPPVNATVGSWAQVLAAAKLDDSGKAIAALLTAQNFDPANDQQLQLFSQSGTTLSRGQQLPAGADPEALAVLDVNLDGYNDLVGALAGDDALVVYTPTLDTASLNGPTMLPVAGAPDALALADFSGDLRPDLAAIAPQANTIRLWRSTPAGPVAVPAGLPYASQSYDALVSGDFNNDGYDDLVALRGAGYSSGAVVVYLQQAGSFPISTTLSPQLGGYLPQSLAVGDLNGDGLDDLVVTAGGNQPDAYLNVFLQGPDDLATTPVTYPAYNLPSAVAVADVNHDGREDVVVAHDGWRTVSVYTQNTAAVEVRVKGLTGWMPAVLNGTSWSAMVNLPADSAGRSWWIEARAISGGRYQAPPARVRIRASGRVRDGLVAEYLFDERNGTTIHDSSGVGTPLDLTLADEHAVSRVPAGIFVHTPTRVASLDPASKVTTALKAANAFTLEAWVRTANLKQEGPARIMTLSDDSQHLNVSLVQSRFGTGTARVGLRLSTSTPPDGKDWHESLAELPLSTDLTHLLVTRDAEGTLIFYINGVEQGRSQAPGDFSGWCDDYQLLFGNDALAERPWLGEYHLAAIYQRALTADEVVQNYAAGPVGDGSPALITDAQLVYTFNEGDGTTVGDSSPVLPALPAQIADPTKVSWGDGSLSVNEPTIIAGDGPATRVNRASMATGEISVEAWVTPANTTQCGPAQILTIGTHSWHNNLSLAQGTWGHERADRYVARVRSSGDGHDDDQPYLRSSPGSLTPALTYVVFTHDAAGVERLYINGVEQAGRHGAGTFGGWDASYPLALANLPGMNRPWIGSYHYLAISSRALSAAQISAHYQAGAEGPNGTLPLISVGLFVQQVVVNGGADTTADRTITLDISVEVPTGQSLDQLTVAEYGFDSRRNVWKLLQRGRPTGTAAGGYTWTLKPGAGVRYLQVWATDTAGTTSSYPYQTFINLIPTSVDLEQRHIDVYRFGLSAGESFSALIAVVHGDADLYVWGPAGDSSMRWVSNGEGSSEAVSFTAPVNGVYQVEVHGYSHAEYQLSVSHGAATPQAAGTSTLAMQTLSVLDTTKELSAAPAISVDSAPAFDGVGDSLVYLPLVIR